MFYSLFTNLNLQSRYYSVINYVDKKILNNLFLDVDKKNNQILVEWNEDWI